MAGKREVGDIFAQQHAALNAAQREAVSAIEGPVMVVAGPGTGKTRVLTLRIANILHKTGVRPEAILALTFTETGASEMRRRLAELIGAASYHLHIFTFHGFCNEVIGRYPESFPGLAGRTATDEVEQIDILEAAFRTLELALLKPFGDPLHYVRPARTAIGSIKREGVSPDDFLGRLRRDETRFSGIEDLYHDSGPHKGKMKGKYQRARRELDKNVELAAVYRRYQEELAARKRYDYDDMILEVLNALRRDQVLTLSLQEQSAYILVDEHQDTNNAQNAVLEYISGGSERPNLFVVGDEKQAIFRFQGASLENFLYFKQRYPGARLITLTENYRSTQHILDLAQSVISHNRRSIATILKGLATELVAKTAVAPVLAECYRFARAEDEHRFVAGKIQELIAGGARPEEIAVLYRENRESDAVARALARRAVPYRIESARDILDDALVRKLLRLLKAVHDLSDDEALFAVLHLDFLGIAPLDVYKVSAGRGARRRGLATIMADRAALEALGVEAPDAMGALTEKLLSWYRRARTDDALSALTMIIEESGLSRALLKDDGVLERIEMIRRLIKTARALAVGKRDFLLGDFLRYIETLESHGIPIKYER
ncbi:MAG: ATP-dependent helicase, partial [bacterium]|nr:ATP-dependent helicase [bacterium]